jgi:hypothetical protein
MSVESSDFHKKLNEYIIESPGRMYIFEVTKLCGYSTFVFMYKDETLLDLYNRISHHFGCRDIKGLYIDSHLHKKSRTNNDNNNNNSSCCINKDKLISVPFSSLTSVKEFIFNNTAKEPRNLAPVYSLPFPVVYRIYLDDGHCHDHKC